MDTIANRVKGVIANVLGTVDIDNIDDSNTISELGGDSLDDVEIEMELEKEFDLTIPDFFVGELNTVGGIIRFIEASKE